MVIPSTHLEKSLRAHHALFEHRYRFSDGPQEINLQQVWIDLLNLRSILTDPTNQDFNSFLVLWKFFILSSNNPVWTGLLITVVANRDETDSSAPASFDEVSDEYDNLTSATHIYNLDQLVYITILENIERLLSTQITRVSSLEAKKVATLLHILLQEYEDGMSDVTDILEQSYENGAITKIVFVWLILELLVPDDAIDIIQHLAFPDLDDIITDLVQNYLSGDEPQPYDILYILSEAYTVSEHDILGLMREENHSLVRDKIITSFALLYKEDKQKLVALLETVYNSLDDLHPTDALELLMSILDYVRAVPPSTWEVFGKASLVENIVSKALQELNQVSNFELFRQLCISLLIHYQKHEAGDPHFPLAKTVVTTHDLTRLILQYQTEINENDLEIISSLIKTTLLWQLYSAEHKELFLLSLFSSIKELFDQKRDASQMLCWILSTFEEVYGFNQVLQANQELTVLFNSLKRILEN